MSCTMVLGGEDLGIAVALAKFMSNPGSTHLRDALIAKIEEHQMKNRKRVNVNSGREMLTINPVGYLSGQAITDAWNDEEGK